MCISSAIYLINLSHCLCPSQLSLSPFGTDWPCSSPFHAEGLLPRVCLSPTHACTVVSVDCSHCSHHYSQLLVVEMWCHSLPHLHQWKSVHDFHRRPLPSPLNTCCLCFLPQIHRTPLTRLRSLTWTRCGVHWHNSQLTLQSRCLDRDQCGQISADCTELMGMYHDCTLYTSNNY